jgi:hypothetical protein
MNQRIGFDRIAKRLEDMGAKTGEKLWRRSFLKTGLYDETYLGVKYFNTMRIGLEESRRARCIARGDRGVPLSCGHAV